MIDGHGDDLYKYGDIRSNFSSNIYSHADLTALKEHLKVRLDTIGSYPEPQPYTLQNLLAEHHAVPADSILVTNGATEAIYLIAQAFRNGIFRQGESPSYFVKRPTFSEYEDAMSNLSYPESESLFPNTEQELLAWLCNPNNPTGEVMPQSEIDHILNRAQTLLVIDQSYEHYTQLNLFSVREAVQRRNLILVHSMTKTYAIPGLRIGYITAAPEIIRKISRFQHPWSVNALAIEAALFLLKDCSPVLPDMASYLHETELLRSRLNKIDGISVAPTQTNFMLCKTAYGTAAQMKTYLAEHYQMLIRDASNFKGLTNKHFRVATQTPEENTALVNAIETYVSRFDTHNP